MAIYNVEYMDEQFQDDSEEMLDGMLEACDAMMQMVESTAAQRHYGMTSKDYDKMYDTGMARSATKYLDNKNLLGHMAVRNAAKQTRDDKLDKNIERGIKIGDRVNKIGGKIAGQDISLSDREKEEARVMSKAGTKGAVGSLMGRAARAGYDVKGTFDKAQAKEAKKKAIKETCLNILAVIDEL